MTEPMNESDGAVRDYFGRPLASHVSPELVRPISWFTTDPFTLARALRDEPPMIYTLRNPMMGQSWVPTRAALIRQVATNPTLFSSNGQAGFSELIGEKWQLNPLELDPPQHGKFRKILEPWFTPSALAKLNEQVDSRAHDLVDSLRDKGGCEFISEFAEPFPVSIFLDLMGWPQDLAGTMQKWNFGLIHGEDPEVRSGYIRKIASFLRTIIAESRAAPRNDLTSHIVTSEVDGKPLDDDTILGMLFLVFGGGLDTVTATLGFHFSYLAKHPELQDHLRQCPGDIGKTIDELLRAFAPATNTRRATADTELGGVAVKAGDWITLLWATANLDPRESVEPEKVDIHRANKTHMTFSTGPHFCIGNRLAKRELMSAYQEILGRLPPFRLAEDFSPEIHPGMTAGYTSLQLRWD